jgi:dipeptide/tripeptide permease
MGINLGAFLSPLVCGWLAAYTLGKYHSGFAAAGIGMLVGMIIYVFGQRLVIELDQGAQPEPVTENKPKENAGAALTPAISETEAERTSSVVPFLNRITPAVLAAIGICLVISGPVLVLPAIGLISFNSLIAMEIAGVCALIAAWIASKVHSAVRDRVLTVYILGLFVVCFWAGFEQAGNVLNVWADQTTNRYLTQDALKPSLYPEVNEEVDQETRPEQGGLGRWLNMFKFKSGKSTPLQTESNAVSDNWWTKLWNPVSTEWFQSINALAIFLLAPIFAMMWTALERRRISPSIPTKMALGVVLMSVAFGFMVFAAKQEDRPTTAHLKASKLPDAIQVNEQNQLCHKRKDGKGLETPYHSGRLVFDPNTQLFHLRGVLPDVERDRIVRDTSPDDFVKKTEELQSKSNEAQGKVFRVEVQLNKEPPGFEMRYTGFNKTEVYYDPTTRTLSSTIRLKDRDVKALWLAAGDPEFRETINDLFQESSIYRVSPWWLFWFYIIATLGELCLSPVGLSMVSKLAPAKFATMLMGLWMLTSFFGNFAAGAAGELYGTVAPTPFFLGFVIFLASASLVLFLLVRKIVGMMHGVN